MSPAINITKTDILSDNWYTLKKVTYEYTTPDGTKQTLTREAYDRGNGAAILLYNTEQKTVILTRQFRLPTYINGNADGMLIETCAGLLDEKDPEACARREAQEETGYTVGEVKKAFEAYMSPGAVTEILYFYVAPYTADMKTSAGGGLEEEHEDIEVLELPAATAMAMIETGEIRDAKTIMLLQYAALQQLV